jgi:hypothetical protein
MTITAINLAFFDESLATVEIVANAVTFYVQTVDAEYRSDLGCLITTPGREGDISFAEYHDFDLALIVSAAEKFMKEEVYELTYMSNGIYLREINGGRCEILKENPSFINPITSSYQVRFDTLIGTFSSIDDAKEHFDTAVEHHAETGESFQL